ncbi:MAG: endolytic transglycosylase MltG [Patescibacteria group bacterium]|nr:endolytic transglycosylase MltG [Patescibacteria group bacterium]
MQLAVNFKHKNKIIISSVLIFILAAAAGGFLLFYEMRPVNSLAGSSSLFQVQPGQKFSAIVQGLRDQNFIRSQTAFKIASLVTGTASYLKPGYYSLSQNMSSWQIIEILNKGLVQETTITIPEGTDLEAIDGILSAANITPKGALIKYNQSLAADKQKSLEGYLFPDTYTFLIGSNIQEVVGKFSANFQEKAEPILAQDPKNSFKNLILASILQKEANSFTDQQIIAGILEKRIKEGMRLQLDATVCYAKELVAKIPYNQCEPLTKADLKINSPYNTYVNYGLPPGPISNPGTSSILAALSPQSSPYWYYIGDPKTGRIIFAKNYDEQIKNIAQYLR